MVIHKPPALDLVFHALADPTRRRIVERLSERKRPVMELAGMFSISQPAVTKHLHVLEQAGLIVRRKHGRQRLCELKPHALEASIVWMDRCRRFWNARLDALEAYVAENLTTRETKS